MTLRESIRLAALIAVFNQLGSEASYWTENFLGPHLRRHYALDYFIPSWGVPLLIVLVAIVLTRPKKI